jgi:hypothetical protein
VRLRRTHTPLATVSTPERRISWGPLPFEKASESDSGTAYCSVSQLNKGKCAQHSAGGLFPAPTGSFTSGSNERVVARRATQQTREEANSGAPLASIGKPRSDAPCWYPVEQWSQLPTREEEERRCSWGNQLRAGSSCSPLDAVVTRGAGSHSPAVTAVCASAFRRRNGHGGSQRITEVERRTGRIPPCGVSEFLCGCAQGTQSCVVPPVVVPFKGAVSPSLPLDNLPMSANKAEISIPEAQLPTYRSALQMYVLTDSSPLTERDFRRRAAAYRNNYYQAYRQATLRGFPDKHLLSDLLVFIQTDAYTPSPPTKYKDIFRMVEVDLKALQDTLPAALR